MINWHQRHLDKAISEKREILLAGATLDQAINALRQKQLPVGASWFWALGTVGPKGSAVQPDRRSGE